MNITAFELAQRFVGLKEVPGAGTNAAVLAMLQLDAGSSIKDDATPWCSAFVNYVAWLLRLPRSKSLSARSWLTVGRPIAIHEARAAFDIVILKRGGASEPGPDVLAAPGHVGFFASRQEHVYLLGGNQGDSVSIAPFAPASVLGVRRLYEEV